MNPTYRVGQRLRVRASCIECLIPAYAKKVQDRDCVVVRPIMRLPYTYELSEVPGRVSHERCVWNGRYVVEFQKRGNRGKVFIEDFREQDLEPAP